MAEEAAPVLAAIRSRTLREHAYHALQEAIFDGRLAPGVRLIEAIHQLEGEGLVPSPVCGPIISRAWRRNWR